MEFKAGVLVAVMFMAMVMFVPMSGDDASDTEVFSYYSQLTADESAVYKEVYKATTVDGSERTFTVDLDGKVLFDDEASASKYAKDTVRKALEALYLSTAMIPYIWDLPVTDVEVEPDMEVVTVTHGEVSETYYVVASVAFNLSVPAGITAESMKELETAISSINVGGKTKAENVSYIVTHLSGIAFEADQEGEVSNIYDALVVKKTTSAGVAQAFNQLCKNNDILSISVTGIDTLAKEETNSYWNYVYLEGDIEGETKYAWFIVDSSYCATAGIAGYATTFEKDGQLMTMASTHSAEQDLSLPQLNKDKYVKVGGPDFLELHGEKIILIAMAAIIVVAMLYAVRTGSI